MMATPSPEPPRFHAKVLVHFVQFDLLEVDKDAKVDGRMCRGWRDTGAPILLAKKDMITECPGGIQNHGVFGSH